MKRLDQKLDTILAGHYRPKDFIIADAKDADMGFATSAPGPVLGADGKPTGKLKTLNDYLDQIRAVVKAELADIMLMSISTFDRLTHEGLFAQSGTMPAMRYNDTTDIWALRHAEYREQPSLPFRTVRLDRAKEVGAGLGLYSMTFTNNVDRDTATLAAYRDFRGEAFDLGLTHFLEVFNPNIATGMNTEATGQFVNDCIVHALAGMSLAERPRFLKIQYNGARALEELVAYDDRIVVGILGGSSGTTADTFNLVHLTEKHGARVALFGRKINLSESPLDILYLMRQVVEANLTPLEAVRAYHDELTKKGLTPKLSIEDDLKVTDPIIAADL